VFANVGLYVPAAEQYLSQNIHSNRKKGRGDGALYAIRHLGVVGEPGGSGRGECVRGAINNRGLALMDW